MVYLSDLWFLIRYSFNHLSDYIVLTFYGYHFHPSKGISSGDISNFVGIPPLLFGDISLDMPYISDHIVIKHCHCNHLISTSAL